MAREYYGTFRRVDISDKEESKNIGSRESAVGSRAKLVFGFSEGQKPVVQVLSQNGYSFGRFDDDFSEKLNYLKSTGHEVAAIVSSVGFSSEEGGYWVELAIFAYQEQDKEAFEKFLTSCQIMYADGKRPDPDLTHNAITSIRETNGEWDDPKMALLPKLPKNETYVKVARTPGDKLIGEAVSGNKGCLIGGWAAIIAAAAVIFWIVWKFLIV